MRDAGMTFREIGTQLGLSHTYCFKLHREAMDEYAAELRATAHVHAENEIRRLERLIIALWPQRADPATNAAIRRNVELKAKLLGLAPTRVEHSGTVEVETSEDRRRRILEETADEFARMTPDELARVAADL